MTRHLLGLATAASMVCMLCPVRETIAQPSESTNASALRRANAALRAGQYGRALLLARPITSGTGVDATDRAEAYRVYGLSLFFLNRRAGAEAALLEYIKLDADAHLDPGVVPPEAVVFFEDLRSRHAAELRASRPRTGRRLHWWYNLAPPLGQLQNGQHGKAWFLAIASGVSLATNVTTFLVLRSWCDRATSVCDDGDADRSDTARALELANMASGAALIGLYAYGVFDGFTGYRRARRHERTLSFMVTPVAGGGAALYMGGSF